MIFTTLGPDHPLKVVAEVGSGGGRVAAQVAGLVPRLVCFDISDVMLKRAQKTLKERKIWKIEHIFAPKMTLDVGDCPKAISHKPCLFPGPMLWGLKGLALAFRPSFRPRNAC